MEWKMAQKTLKILGVHYSYNKKLWNEKHFKIDCVWEYEGLEI